MNKIFPSINWDLLGLSASFLCVMHCIALPFIIMFFPLLGMSFLENSLTEMGLILSSVSIAAIAIIRGYVSYHKKKSVLFMLIGAVLLFLLGILIEHPTIEKGSHLIATILLIVAHLFNWKEIRKRKKCSCSYCSK
ncbi:MerC domain-containing protein [Aquimarina hainanensis]|uniref:MerC domain-containing protein n=1 Tax=Aquimarina hainanensis TaxID=1578017 RepID=A0ABW5NCI0_9FLAO|nr:MerC domain-containing protein [Aquimarina sp. TRL1]QKX07213.1 MerC domain-containing protein [Aquimarina sp. TRL1]